MRHREQWPSDDRGQATEHAQPDPAERRAPSGVGDAKDTPGNGEADSHVTVVRRNRARRAEVVGAHERPLPKAVSANGVDHVALALRQLQVEMDPDGRCFVHEEPECLVQRRRLRPDVLEPVRHEERAVGACDDIELDEVDAGLDRGAERLQSVLRGEGPRSTVADAQRASVSTP